MFFTPLVMYVFAYVARDFLFFRGVKNKLEMRNEKLEIALSSRKEIRN